MAKMKFVTEESKQKYLETNYNKISSNDYWFSLLDAFRYVCPFGQNNSANS